MHDINRYLRVVYVRSPASGRESRGGALLLLARPSEYIRVPTVVGPVCLLADHEEVAELGHPPPR